ncbi:MAG: putative toxin-antitoxin system toxin component, PIN family [Oscillospiraceae bacterium]|nr:putative toxin-antitoxin system toxin component, PIN family [Oscillospiraceae bacterium]
MNMRMIESVSDMQVSRDPDDDKFIECAVDAKALFVVSGDKDLLVLERYEDVEIISAAEFCRRYLP